MVSGDNKQGGKGKEEEDMTKEKVPSGKDTREGEMGKVSNHAKGGFDERK